MGILTDVQNIGASTRSADNVERRILKATEELGELAEAALSATSASNAKGKSWMDVIDEACDVAIMGIDIAMTRPPGYESMSDEAWREIVKKLFALKLKKWQSQVKHGRTLIPVSELPVTPREDCATLAGIEHGFDDPFPKSTKGCGHIMGHGVICGRGMLCINCQNDEETNAGLHK